MTDLLRKALGTSSAMPAADPAAIAVRRRIVEKFLSGEWGVELTGFEAARAADRESVRERNDQWRG